MSIGDWFRRMFTPSGAAEQAEEEAAQREEYGTPPDEGEEYLKESEYLSGGAVIPGFAASEAAEAGVEDLETEEAPPDLDP
jgi:hypothetical protein